MTTPNRPPLWETMRAAYDCSTAPNGSTDDWTERDGFAAEIRALRDWLVPEEAPFSDSVHGGNRYARQSERQRLRALLTAEADRAELEGTTRDPLEPNDLSHLSDEEF